MALKLDTLNAATPIIDKKKFTPTPQFILFWQRTIQQIQTNDAQQEQLLDVVQQQQRDILALLEYIAANVAYQNDLGEWLTAFLNLTSVRVGYLQEAVAVIAIATDTTLPDPPPYPPYPGPPPTPPGPITP